MKEPFSISARSHFRTALRSADVCVRSGTMFSVPRHSCSHCSNSAVKFSVPKIVHVTLVAPSPVPGRRTFKERRSLAMRRAESADVKMKFPGKVPVVVERCEREKVLPRLDRVKFLVPQDMTLSHFLCRVRSRLKVGASQSVFLMVRNHTVESMSRSMAEVYFQHKDEDGFLYATYASQEMYG